MSRIRRKRGAGSKRPYSRPNVEFLEMRLAPALAGTSSAVQFNPQIPPPGFTGNGVASVRIDAVVELDLGQKQAFANFDAVANEIPLTGGEGGAELKIDKAGILSLDAAAVDYFLTINGAVSLRHQGNKDVLSFETDGTAKLKLAGAGAEAKVQIDGGVLCELDGVQGGSSVSSLQIEHVADLQLQGSEQQAFLKFAGADGLNWTLGETVADANVQGEVSLTRGDIGPSDSDKILIGLLLPPIVNQGPAQGTAASVVFEDHVQVGDAGGLVDRKVGFDAGDRPGGGCIMFDSLDDLRAAQSEIVGRKHLEAMGSVASLELDSAASLQVQDILGGQTKSAIHIKGNVASLVYSSLSRIGLSNDLVIAEYGEHVQIANASDIVHAEVLSLSPSNGQILAEYKEDFAITPIQGSQASIQLDEVVHFKVGNLEKTFVHDLAEGSSSPNGILIGLLDILPAPVP